MQKQLKPKNHHHTTALLQIEPKKCQSFVVKQDQPTQQLKNSTNKTKYEYPAKVK